MLWNQKDLQLRIIKFNLYYQLSEVMRYAMFIRSQPQAKCEVRLMTCSAKFFVGQLSSKSCTHLPPLGCC